jgi:protein tyrosine/serine phosphatase
MPRVLPTTTVHNFRDYGGYAVQGGGRVRRGALYRSAELSQASAADQTLIAGLNLATIIDLRSMVERQAAPSQPGPGFVGEIVACEAYAEVRAPHERAAQEGGDAAQVRAWLHKAFGKIPFQPVMVPVFRLYFTALATRPGASLVHCMAGKDRTGIAVALLQAALGVHRDDITADFLLTNTAGDTAARYAAQAPRIRQSLGGNTQEDAVIAVLSVESDYLDAMFAAIEERGGLAAYFHKTLGITPQQLEALRRNLIV